MCVCVYVGGVDGGDHGEDDGVHTYRGKVDLSDKWSLKQCVDGVDATQ